MAQRYRAINIYADLRERYVSLNGIEPGDFMSLNRQEQWISCECDGMRVAARMMITDMRTYTPLGIHTAWVGEWEAELRGIFGD